MRCTVNFLTTFSALLMALLIVNSCNGQSGNTSSPSSKNSLLVGGGCDGCELMFIGMPEKIYSIDTSAGWKEKGQPLVIHGQAFAKDGVTPAPNIIVYYWQTDNNGYYSPSPEQDQRTKRHGHIRGWIKTDKDGRYTLYTIRPAPYPKEDMPAHIHLSVKEPGISNEYYIDELVFDDDKLLTAAKRSKMENRGGSGILKTRIVDGTQSADHSFVAGKNIPNYPK